MNDDEIKFVQHASKFANRLLFKSDGKFYLVTGFSGLKWFTTLGFAVVDFKMVSISQFVLE